MTPVDQRGLRAVLAMLAPKYRVALEEAHRAYEAAGVPHALCGGMAAGAHGEPRATKDVDFLVGNEVFATPPGALVVAFKSGIPIAVGDIPVDSVPIPTGHERVLLEGLAKAVVDEGIPVLPAAYVAYMKLVANRGIDRVDVRRMIDAGLDPKSIRVLGLGAELEQRLARLLAEE